MAMRINGKAIAAALRGEIAAEVEQLKAQGICPGLAVILVGSDPASCTYVRNKQKACQEAGIHAEQIDLPESTTQEELLAVVAELNARKDIHGILCQLP
ncbi:MAG: bifunctional 5,10-methylene-tetrahydrofolate dehydrogenase/5,10-methylene-tetrahydrofolate cyclohydrolase, partial [Clostridia bacterium]|nr:bifunctional 5,10-methylene-tetrahydrofolate dehydrogenase/5,10-methylene-tetrahydrofolate cyclohydrolase [Clostridia bacterium]